MAEPNDNMVLRTVYLPLVLDRELRHLAFTRDVSKADLIREFILQGLTMVEASGEKTLAARVQERILPPPAAPKVSKRPSKRKLTKVIGAAAPKKRATKRATKRTEAHV